MAHGRAAAGTRTAARALGDQVVVESVAVSLFVVPTAEPEEADGTLEWSSTPVVVVHVAAGGERGMGYTYAGGAAASFVRELFADVVTGRDARDPRGSWSAMVRAARNAGLPGAGAMAVSAIDVALWDLAARLDGVPVTHLVGRLRDDVIVYGSGGFVSYPQAQLERQLSEWAAAGMSSVKMKVGRDLRADVVRVAGARKAIGEDVELFVDANGAYQRQQALAFASAVEPLGVSWFEEPVSSDDLDGLRLVRDRSPAGMEVAAGEYGWAPWYFARMIDAGAVDVLQADVTRCGGFTGFAAVAALCQANHLDLSAHCAPQLSAHAGACAPTFRHVEYFVDHVRVEHLLFDGVLEPTDGVITPDRGTVGHGLVLKETDAARFWRAA